MSEKNLDQLINSLKTEAIDNAEKEAEKILTDAKQQAQQIVQAAEKKKATVIVEAERESAAILEKGEAALRQAGRDYSISVRNELLDIFQSLLEAETRKAFTPDLMKNAIVKVIENIGGDVELTLSPENAKELADYIHDRLKSSGKIVSIVENNSVLHGFTIALKKEGWSYAVSPEEVATALQKYLNKNWINILKKEA
ncbi:MAG: hypothetical protein AAFZ15_26845 [Bacteroidota bacterium]